LESINAQLEKQVRELRGVIRTERLGGSHISCASFTLTESDEELQAQKAEFSRTLAHKKSTLTQVCSKVHTESSLISTERSPAEPHQA
jgi:hypothetical protein